MSTSEYNNQALVEQLHRIADALENGQRKENAPMDEQSRKKAAYALNLCLVSVSGTGVSEHPEQSEFGAYAEG